MFRALLRRRAESRAMQVLPWGPWRSSASTAGVTVDTDTALQHLTVYGCVSLIAETIAALPLDVYDQRGETPAPPWVDRPNPDMDRVTFVGACLTSLLLDGNAYVVVSPDDTGMPVSLDLLDPARMSYYRTAGRPVVWTVDGQPLRAPWLHLRGLSRPGAVLGMSPVEAARQSIGLGLAAQRFGGEFFSQGIALSGVIEVPGELTLEQSREMAEGWRRDHAGLDRAHLPGVLKGGATWRATSMTAEQAQFLETRRFQAAEIAGQMFRVDPSLIGLGVEGTSLTYANLESRGLHLVQYTLLPWLVRLERMYALLLGAGRYAKFNVAGLLRADLASRYAAYKIGVETGFLTANEARVKEDLEPLPDGDTLRAVPSGVAASRDDDVAAELAALRARVETLAEPRPRGLRIVRAADGTIEEMRLGDR